MSESGIWSHDDFIKNAKLSMGVTDECLAKMQSDDNWDPNDPYFGDNGDEPDHSDDPFFDGESHKPSGLIHTPNRKIISGKATTQSKKRGKSKATFDIKTRQYWESQGYWVEKVESWQFSGQQYVRKDLYGCFDFEATKKDSPRVLIQVSSKGDVRSHLRKMLTSDEEYRPGKTRRDIINHLQSIGTKMFIHWFDKPEGQARWTEGVEELTPVLIANVDAGKRTTRSKT